MDRVKRIWYLTPMRVAKVQASLRIHAVSPEPSLLAHKSSESRGTFRQKARSLAPLNGWACAVKVCHDGMLEDTDSLDGAHIFISSESDVFEWRFALTVISFSLLTILIVFKLKQMQYFRRLIMWKRQGTEVDFLRKRVIIMHKMSNELHNHTNIIFI